MARIRLSQAIRRVRVRQCKAGRILAARARWIFRLPPAATPAATSLSAKLKAEAAGQWANTAQLNLSGLATFNANVDQVLIGYANTYSSGDDGERANGVMYLAQSNTLTINSPASAYATSELNTGLLSGMQSQCHRRPQLRSILYLGHTNVINVDDIIVGARRQEGIHGIQSREVRGAHFDHAWCGGRHFASGPNRYRRQLSNRIRPALPMPKALWISPAVRWTSWLHRSSWEGPPTCQPPLLADAPLARSLLIRGPLTQRVDRR